MAGNQPEEVNALRRRGQAGPPGLAAIVLWAGAVGAVAGVLGALARGLDRFGFGLRERFTLDTVWMTPLAETLILAAVGLLLGLVSPLLGLVSPLLGRGRRTRAAAFGCAAAAAASVLLYYHPRLHRYAAVILAAGLAWRLSAWLAASPAWRRMAARVLGACTAAGTVAAVVVLAWPAWHERAALSGRAVPAVRHPNVILVVLDTVRAANLSLYGYARPTSPHLAAVAAQGLRFDRAIAPAPWTGPSHASMFTGRYPYELSVDWTVPLDATAPTIAERLSAAGFVTAGFVGNNIKATEEFGFARGFDRYDDRSGSVDAIAGSSGLIRTLFGSPRFRRTIGYYEFLGRRHAPEITQRFLDWQAGVEGRPFFAFLNYFDAHDPYLPPAETRGQFGSTREPRDPWVVQESWKHRGQWSPARVAPEVAAYDESIAALDGELGRLIAALRVRGVLDETLIIITSDHGEEFGEHGQLSHGRNLFIGTLHVPLVMRLPGRVPIGAVAAPVGLRDLPATILDVAGVVGPPMPGRSLRRAWDGTAPQELEPALSVLRGSVSIVDGRYHYVRGRDGAESVYDWWDDPSEQHDLARTETIQRLLSAWRAQVPSGLTAAEPR